MVLVHRRGDSDGGRKCHSPGDVVEQPVADAHGLHSAPVAALQALDGEAELACLAEVVRRAHHHPVLERATFGAPGFSLSSRAAAFLRAVSRRRGFGGWFFVCHGVTSCGWSGPRSSCSGSRTVRLRIWAMWAISCRVTMRQTSSSVNDPPRGSLSVRSHSFLPQP